MWDLFRCSASFNSFCIFPKKSSFYRGESQNSKENPTHFLLLRLSTSKVPCLTIKAAFLGGTSGSMRFKVLKELKQKVFALKFKQGGSQLEKSKKSPKVAGEKRERRKPPLDRDWSETPCCVMLTKPMENILIRLNSWLLCIIKVLTVLCGVKISFGLNQNWEVHLKKISKNIYL